LRDVEPGVRYCAAEALGRIGRDARDAVPTLMELQTDGVPPVRNAATRALVRIVTEEPASAAKGADSRPALGHG